MKDVGAILGFGTSLNGGVLVAHERIVVEVSHGEDLVKSLENGIGLILIAMRSQDPICDSASCAR